MKNKFWALFFFAMVVFMGNASSNWQKCYVSPNSSLTSLWVNDTTLFVGKLGLARSTDFGLTWTNAESGMDLSNSNFAFAFATMKSPTSENRIFASLSHPTVSGKTYYSIDNGNNWKGTGPGLTSFDIRALAVNDTNIFAGAKDSGVYVSLNGGASWIVVNNGLPKSQFNFFGVSPMIASGRCVFAGIGVRVFRTIDKGNNWAEADSGLPFFYSYVKCFASIDTNMFVGLSCLDGSTGGVFLSTDNGARWNSVNNGISDSAAIYGFAACGKYLFAGGSSIYLSKNLGRSWTIVDRSGLPLSFVSSLAVCGDYIFAVIDTEYGQVWRRPLSEIGVTRTISDNSKAQQKEIRYHVQKGALHLSGVSSCDQICLFSLSGRCLYNSYGSSKIKIGNAHQPLLIRIKRENTMIKSGMVMME